MTIGAVAAQQQGAVLPAARIDITPAAGRPNLERLSTALDELGARVRTVEDRGRRGARPRRCVSGSLGELESDVQPRRVDLPFRPSDTDGFHDLIRDVRMGRVGDRDLPVASLSDMIRMTTAAVGHQDIEV